MALLESPMLTTQMITTMREEQCLLASQVDCTNHLGVIETIAGIDVSGYFKDPSKPLSAAVVVLSAHDLQVQHIVSASVMPPIPYIPGLLAFREIPVVLAALAKLNTLPGLFFVDGHGYSHPKHCGIASHLGVIIQKPTIGVAKNILIGTAEPLPEIVGAQAPLYWHHEIIAMTLKSRKHARPIIISAGHHIDLPTALSWVKKTLTIHRLPIPTRLAHYYSNQARCHLLNS